MGGETDRFYAENATRYAATSGSGDAVWRDRFTAQLAAGSTILELGCGGGRDSAAMIAAGFRVTPTDGIAEMAAQAQARLRQPVRVLRFGDLTDENAYDGIWANACLLHVPRPDLPDILARIRKAIRSGGLFYASFKAGDAEGHDGLGRFYNYPDVDWLRRAYATGGWRETVIETADGGGYDNRPTRWLHVFARP